MFVKEQYSENLTESYEILLLQLKHLIEGETDLIANLSNASALLNQFLENINWVGFYLFKNNELILGPFQGLPACIHIPLNKGVCGTAAYQKQTLVIKNVHEFSGHIACDGASNSEIVIPFVDKLGQLVGVLDVDSPNFDRFNECDQHYLEEFVAILSKH